jgi:hypothetical protein
MSGHKCGQTYSTSYSGLAASTSVSNVSIEIAREHYLMYRERAGEPASENLLDVIRCAVTDVVNLHDMSSHSCGQTSSTLFLQRVFQSPYLAVPMSVSHLSVQIERESHLICRAGGRASERELCALTHTFTHPPSKKVRPQWARSLRKAKPQWDIRQRFAASMSVFNVSIAIARES